VGQQPNIRLGIQDLPRPEAHPAAPRRWSPRRPGELGSPDEVPWGGAFGTPGPDAGYAMTVLASRDIPVGEGEDRHDVAAALAALMVARASHFGRAPVAADADVAEVLLGYRSDGLGEETRERLAALRRRLLPGFGHTKHRGRDLVAAFGREVLTAPPGAVPGLLDAAPPA
jgi:hypothetical protein